MAHWQRICLPMQEMRVQSLSQEDPLAGENGNPLQYFCLGNPIDRGAWWATVHPWSHKRVGHDLGTKQQQQQQHIEL